MALARMGCCTSLLYGTTGTSKNTVKAALNISDPAGGLAEERSVSRDDAPYFGDL
jgi:hypothetical protein